MLAPYFLFSVDREQHGFGDSDGDSLVRTNPLFGFNDAPAKRFGRFWEAVLSGFSV